MEQMIDFLYFNFDYLVIGGIIILSIIILILHHKNEVKKDKEIPVYLTKPIKRILFSIRFVSAIIGVLTICVCYLFFRIAGVLPNLLMGIALHL